MPGFTSHATIDRPREDVFAFITDLSNASRLSPSIIGVEPITEGEMREGYVFKETRKMGSREATADIRISAFDPPNMYAASSDWKGSTFTYTYELSPVPGGATILTMTCDASLKGVMMRLMAPMIIRAMRKADGDHPERIKQLLESEG